MRTKIQFLLGAMLCVLLLATTAQAQVATTYSSNKRTLKVGILLLDSTDINDGRGPENPDPFIFYIADSRNDVKPQNWEFINPLSPKTVTIDVAARWTARTNNLGQQYQVGQQITKNMAAYWEVSLTDTPLQDMLQFDLLFLTNHRVTRLTAADREKLRKLVDAGGVLWLEDCGGMRMDPTGPLFLDQLQFSGGRGEATTGTPFPIVNVPNHPILSTPNALSLQEVANLGDKDYSNYALINIADPTLPPNPLVLVNVVGNNARGGLPYIAAGNYGAGRVIATAGDSGCDINDYAGGLRTSSGGNSGAYCGENLITAHAEDLKFLYNVVAWGSANSQFRKDPRRTGSSFESLGAALVPAFKVGAPPTTVRESRLNSVTAPLVAKGVVYSTGVDVNSGTASVRAYSAHPSLISGDKGLPDLSLGATYDEVWRWDGGGAMPSSPALATVYGGGGGPGTGSLRAIYGDFLFVTLSDGTLVRLTALATDGQGNILPTPGVLPNAPITTGTTYQNPPGWSQPAFPAPAPVISEGKVYVVEPNGRVRCVDAATMTTLWHSFLDNPDVLYRPTGSPTLGYSRLAITSTDSNGRSSAAGAARSSGNSNDLMLYVPVWIEDANSMTNIQRTMTYWLGARHEVVSTDTPPGSGNFRPRAAQSNRQFVALTEPSFLRPVIRVYQDGIIAGNPVTAQENMALGRASTVFSGQFVDPTGIIRVQDSMGNAPTRGAGAPNVIISVDYDVIYITPSATPPGLSQPNTNAARPNPNLSIAGYLSGGEGVAMTPDDILVSATRSMNPRVSTALPVTTISGDYEQFGLTRLRQSFSVFELLSGQQVAQATVANQVVLERPTLTNRLVFTPPLLSETMAAIVSPLGYESLLNVNPIGTPVTTNEGIVYQVLSAVSPANGGTVTVVAALDMKKEVILNLPETYNPAYRVQVSQMDVTAYDPSNAAQPQTISAILPVSTSSVSSTQNLVGDASRGRISVTDMRVSGRRFSSSLSFVVTYVPAGGTSDKTVVITPTPLLPFNGAGADIDSRGIVNGGYSPLLWYYVLPGTPTSSVTLAGDMLYLGVLNGTPKVVALDADPASNDPTVRSGLGLQVEAVFASNNAKVNHVRWVRQTDAIIYGAPVASQGTLALNTIAGLDAFETGVTLITDAKRIIEVDGAGAALWAVDGTIKYQAAGGAVPRFDVDGTLIPGDGRVVVERKTLARPSLARRIGSGDYLICDTGNNRVVRIDRSGGIRWELDDLNDAFGVLSSADAKTLSGPTDVQIFTLLSPGGAGYEIHYLIADAGNNRIVEVADYFDRDGNIRTNVATPNGPQRGDQLVVWVSRTLSKEGRSLRFQSVQRVLTYGDLRRGQNPALYGYPTILAVVGNASAAGGEVSADVRGDFTGGSLLTLEYNPINTTIPLFNNGGVPTGVYTPWLYTNPEPGRNGLVDRTLNELVMPIGYNGAMMQTVRRITGPTSIQQYNLPDGAGGTKTIFLICDASGVYQAELNITNGRWFVTWYFDANDYKALMATRLPGLPPGTRVDVGFQPNSAQRLPNGSYLITNSWIGSRTRLSPAEVGIGDLFAGGQFVGEVFQVTGGRQFNLTGTQTDLVPQPLYDDFSAPRIVTTRNQMGVVIRREQKMGSTTSNTNLLEHPLFGDRQ
ncbi:PQQ-binding-like beta-propeller repeat protein [Armatimonas sp.]|uniref:PQQ-binding-like beta-propeller repeat protein n=1 Tax=Armatimonas sp. TaxID=1872638 RepID=UPI00286C0B31|nr:PQQ-binding-like beta-propeller repeat protein [Armatimonas sp.]